MSDDHQTDRPYAPESLKPRVHQFSIDKETRTWLLLVMGVLGIGGAGAVIRGSVDGHDAVEKKQAEVRLETERVKWRECEQKRLEWMKNQDRLYRAALRKLGASIQGASYPEVDFHPAPAPGSPSPPWQVKEALPEPPPCD